MRKVYLDNNATTPLHPEVLDAMLPFFKEKFGNPSSIHSFGREVWSELVDARESIARLFNCDSTEIFFTSGGTEADNIAVIGTALANSEKGKHIITSAIEHHAVLESCRYLENLGFQVTYLPVSSEGFVNPDDLKGAIRKDTTLVSIMHINNEVGSIQDIKQLALISKEAGVYFHTDAVQSAGKIPVDVRDLGIDSLSASAHKINGPKGSGFVYIKKGTRIKPRMFGGHHENGMRAGTENVTGIIGLGKALVISYANMDRELERYSKLSARFWNGLISRIEDVVLNGPKDEGRLKNTINISFKGIEGEAIILSLDIIGVAVASGSACSSGSTEPSHVLMAMGVEPWVARGSLRISFGKFTTEEEIDYILERISPIVERLRKMSPISSH